jgi:hypothetical protein
VAWQIVLQISSLKPVACKNPWQGVGKNMATNKKTNLSLQARNEVKPYFKKNAVKPTMKRSRLQNA